MKTTLHIFASALFFLALASCGRNPYTEEIAQAESLADTQPDSALVIMQQTNPRMVTNRKAQAHYNLLYSKILDKNYILLDNDSLIAPAFRYYNAPIRRRFISDSMAYAVNYYYATIRQNAGEYHEAIDLYLTAEEHAQRVGDNYINGLINTRLGEIFYEQFHYERALEYFTKSFEYSNQLSDKALANHQKIKIARAHYMRGKSKDEAIQMLEEVREYASLHNNYDILATSIVNLAIVYAANQEYHKALECINTLEANFPTYINQTIYELQTQIYVNTENWREAERYLALSDSTIKETHERAMWHYYSFWAKHGLKKFDETAHHFNQFVTLYDSLIREAISESGTTAENNYHLTKYVATAKLSRVKNFIAGGCIAIILILIVWGAKHNRDNRIRHKRQIEEYLGTINSLQTQTKSANALLEHDNATIRQLRDAVLMRVKTIEELGTALYERVGTKAQQEYAYRQLKQQIENLATDPTTKSELEELVNLAHDNIMLRLREQMPKLKPSDHDLLCYIYAGFSAPIISLLISDEIQNVYAKKSRLKKRIINSDAKDKAYFIEKLS